VEKTFRTLVRRNVRLIAPKDKVSKKREISSESWACRIWARRRPEHSVPPRTPALFLMKLKVVVETLAHLLNVRQPVLEVGLRRLLHDALVAERLLLAAQLLAHPFHPRAQRGEHGLLAFEGRGPLPTCEATVSCSLLHPRQCFRLAGTAGCAIVHLHGLFFPGSRRFALQLS